MIYKLQNRPYLQMRGFTLTEVLVVIAIVGILAAIAVPNFQSIIQANRIQAASSEFQSGLAIARAEAIKRGGDARVTMVANSLIAGKANWNSGFTVFYDTTGKANDNIAPASNANTVLMVTSATNNSVAITSNAPEYITYNGLGRTTQSNGANLSASFTFQAATGAPTSTIRCLVMSITGRTRTAKYSVAEFALLPTPNKCPTL